MVIGGGIAGLTYALRVAEIGSVAVLCKQDPYASSTRWAQGGIAAVTGNDDSFDLHIQDTLACGAGLSDREVVSIVVREGPILVEELVSRGVSFDLDSEGAYHLHREGGH